MPEIKILNYSELEVLVLEHILKKKELSDLFNVSYSDYDVLAKEMEDKSYLIITSNSPRNDEGERLVEKYRDNSNIKIILYGEEKTLNDNREMISTHEGLMNKAIEMGFDGRILNFLQFYKTHGISDYEKYSEYFMGEVLRYIQSPD